VAFLAGSKVSAGKCRNTQEVNADAVPAPGPALSRPTRRLRRPKSPTRATPIQIIIRRPAGDKLTNRSRPAEQRLLGRFDGFLVSE
jgi:hypothetical protein